MGIVRVLYPVPSQTFEALQRTPALLHLIIDEEGTSAYIDEMQLEEMRKQPLLKRMFATTRPLDEVPIPERPAANLDDARDLDKAREEIDELLYRVAPKTLASRFLTRSARLGRVEVGYGAVSVVDPDQVRQVNETLTALSSEAVETALVDAHFDSVDYVRNNFDKLRDVVSGAADRGDAIVMTDE